jgi:hypothetical protein
MTKLLHISRGKLLAIVIGVPILLDFLAGILSSDARTEFFVQAPIINLFPIFTILFWLQTVGSTLNELLPLELRRDTQLLKVAVSIEIGIYLLLAINMSTSWFDAFTDDQTTFHLIFAGLVVLNFICFVYIISFAAKALKMLETRRPISFQDYANEFFWFLAFPLGIWFIQPKINRIFKR